MFETLRLKYKIGFLPLLASTCFIAIFGANLFLGVRHARNLAEIENGYVPAQQLSKTLQEGLADIQRKLQDAVASQDVDMLQEARKLQDEFLVSLSAGDSIPVMDSDNLGQLRTGFASYFDLAYRTSEQMIMQASEEAVVAEGLVARLEAMNREYNGLRTLLDKTAEDCRTGMAASFTAARTSQRISMYMIAIVTIVGVLLLGLLSYWIIRGVNRTLTQASSNAMSTAQQIVAAVKQQSSSSAETAASVSQTSTTIGEIRQTSDVAAGKAKSVVEIAERSITSSENSLAAIEDGIEAMRAIGVDVEGIAKNILDLSKKNLQIGEIVQTVNAIAEQSNLLAVNASIEAAKAGEHGKGFSVVASEVKALAGQSKEATNQIRTILSEVQKSSNAAVMVTEQGVKRVEEGARLIEELGETIRESSQVIEESVDAAKQISMTTNQQLAGLQQIGESIKSIEVAAKNNAASARQLETAAEQVRSVSEQMVAIVDGHRK